MTILQMLEQQCDFIKAPVFDDRPPEIAELRKMDVPDDFWDFYFFDKRPEIAELRRMNLHGDFGISIGKQMGVSVVFSSLSTANLVHLSCMAMKRCRK